MPATLDRPAAKASIDDLQLVLWTDGTADVLLFAGLKLVSRFETDAAEALRLAEWVRDRLQQGRQVPLGEALAELRKPGA